MTGIAGFSGQALPFSAGTIFGVRSFVADPLAQLSALHYDQDWENGENVAVCNDPQNSKVANHSMADCDHGFWAYFGAYNCHSSPQYADAVVEGYGEVVIGEKGFRSSHARVRAVVLPDVRTVMKFFLRSPEHIGFNNKHYWISGLLFAITLLMFYVVMPAIMDSPSGANPVLVMGLIGLTTGSIMGAFFYGVMSLFHFGYWLYHRVRKWRLRRSFELVSPDTEGYPEYLKYFLMKQPVRDEPDWGKIQEQFTAVARQNYPDVEFYDSYNDMIRAWAPRLVMHGALISPATTP